MDECLHCSPNHDDLFQEELLGLAGLSGGRKKARQKKREKERRWHLTCEVSLSVVQGRIDHDPDTRGGINNLRLSIRSVAIKHIPAEIPAIITVNML